MSFSGHLLDDYSRNIESLKTEKISDILQSYSEETGESERYADKERLRVAGIIAKRVNKNTRSGEGMAFVTLEDRFSEMEIVVFPKLLEKIGYELYVENAVCVEGTLSLREGEAPKLLLSNLEKLMNNDSFVKATALQVQKTRKLYIKTPSLSSPLCNKITEKARAFRGQMPIILYGNAEKRYVSVKDITVEAHPDFLLFLYETVGKENVIIQ